MIDERGRGLVDAMGLGLLDGLVNVAAIVVIIVGAEPLITEGFGHLGADGIFLFVAGCSALT